MAGRRTFGGSFSWNRALGVSAAKGRISRAIGVPLTKSGRDKKRKRLTQKVLGPFVLIGLLATIGGMIGNPNAPAPATSTVLTTRTMPGATSGLVDLSSSPLNVDEVREVQARLTTLGFNAGSADGIAGPQTQAAVGRYEIARGTPQTGGVDRQLLGRLRAER